jgi:hypothetical protein
MSNIQARTETAIKGLSRQPMDMKLEVGVIPVSDVDRAKRFYADLGWCRNRSWQRIQARMS